MDGLCGNCGSAKHQRCCARCGATIRRAELRDVGFCTRRCQERQAFEDRESMEMELRHVQEADEEETIERASQTMQEAEYDVEGVMGADYWDVFGAGGHKQ